LENHGSCQSRSSTGGGRPKGEGLRRSGEPVLEHDVQHRLALVLCGRQRLAGELVPRHPSPGLEVGDAAGQRTALVVADHEVLGEEPPQAIHQRLGLSPDPLSDLVGQEIVERVEIGHADLELDPDQRLLDEDLDHGGGGHRLGDDDGVGERDANRQEEHGSGDHHGAQREWAWGREGLGARREAIHGFLTRGVSSVHA
jgi:hypothetical protein